jgi:hypothetical protein
MNLRRIASDPEAIGLIVMGLTGAIMLIIGALRWRYGS